jgi:N-methylhydantoinase A/oxoprolinase/acetone carboxylase beta subunit
MPDIHSIGLGGGTRIHLDRAALNSDPLDDEAFEVGPDSVGFDITTEALVFGGSTLTASDIAIAAGCTGFGNPELLPPITAGVIRAVMTRFRHMLEDGIDRIKTTPGSAPIIAVGGGNFLIPESLKGAASVIRPEHAAVANAIGAAIAQVGAQVEQIVTYETTPRAEALEALRKEACARVVAAGGEASSVRVADIEEVFLSYLPGRAAQIRVKAIGDLAIGGERGNVAAYDDMTKAHHVA